MVECNFIEAPNIYPNLIDQQFRLKKISEDYLIAESRERDLISKKLSKYIASSNYFDKYLIFLFAKSGSISISPFATVIGVSIAITSESFSFAFSMSTSIVKKLLKTTQNKKKSLIKLLC